ncbi:type VI secretion system contractile sheath large subunit [Hahella sp. CR1]|uniref:type VI secretion system contractile sheath large subunit n=1 Tax=Hahella sp. CR1 TaxID=2992807 RepID=UPI002441D7BE|nr:type VI secretion system contractile sheath large subunit [Hahella sp. CR1]MDG9668011.1 type VI secretion system contractile sheath large subunit [Hahella sp. CR1]
MQNKVSPNDNPMPFTYGVVQKRTQGPSSAEVIALKKILQLIKLPDWCYEDKAAGKPLDYDYLILWLQRAVAQIDNKIINQVNHILHHSKFQDLERAWRSLYDVVSYSYGRKLVKIRFLDITWSEITKDVNRSVEFDQSQLFHKIYSEEYDVPGGEPYGIILMNFEVAHKPFAGHRFNDIPTLERLAEIGAASFSPILLNAAPQLFEMASFPEITSPISLKQLFSEQDYISWNSLRDHPDTRFLGLTMPRVLIRNPYSIQIAPHGGLLFSEKRAQASNENYLWGYANFALAKVLIREFTEVGWFSHIRGLLRDHMAGGAVDNLVVDAFATDAKKIAHKPIVDAVFSDERERALSEHGLIALCQCYDVPMGVFYSTPTLHRAKVFQDRIASANSRLSSLLQHVLCGSRFAHYIKVITRDMIGSVRRAEDCERELQRWLTQYVTSQEDADWFMQARYPLREGSVQVKEIPEKPGSFATTIYLRPHYQADRLVSELHLTTEVNTAS